MKLGPQGVVIGFPPGSFFAAQASEPKHTELLTCTVRSQLGPDATVSIELTDAAHDALTLARIKEYEEWERQDKARRRVVEHPTVRAIIEILGAELRGVRLPE